MPRNSDNLISPEKPITVDGSYKYTETLEELDIRDNKKLTKEKVNGYFMWFIRTRTQRRYRDEQLWDSFREVFDGWTENIFQVASTLVRKDLWTCLRANGVHVTVKTGAGMNKELARVVQEEAQQLWTNEIIQIQPNKYEVFNSRFNPRNLNTTSSENIQTKPESMKRETSIFSTQKQQFP
ncbi:hypothetical protein GcM1_236009 [Golovinomyces cichoracearum]|uniref:Uncharacterized protein n=1 Tax=Golovinomyces cichoracearum TaxID=62708 RepID=A0A420IKF2_9PEZI|nr:hypothetical protein GcM1_236009 [Golovinomyces cichoracearum]